MYICTRGQAMNVHAVTDRGYFVCMLFMLSVCACSTVLRVHRHTCLSVLSLFLSVGLSISVLIVCIRACPWLHVYIYVHVDCTYTFMCILIVCIRACPWLFVYIFVHLCIDTSMVSGHLWIDWMYGQVNGVGTGLHNPYPLWQSLTEKARFQVLFVCPVGLCQC